MEIPHNSILQNSKAKLQSTNRNIKTYVQYSIADVMDVQNELNTSNSTAATQYDLRKPAEAIARSASVPKSVKDYAIGVHVKTLSNIYMARAIEAYKHRRIFTVHGNYHTIRRALRRRGWLEKLPPGRFVKLQNCPLDVLLQHAKQGNDYELVAISKITHQFPAFFVWQHRRRRDLYLDAVPYRNRVKRGRYLDFSTKVGLIGCAEQEHWYKDDGVSEMSYPRFYRLGGNFEERMAFIEDFRRTQCRALVKFINENIDNPSELIDEDDGTVLINVAAFAIKNINRQLNDLEHNTLDNDTESSTNLTEWRRFINDSTLILQRKAKFKASLSEMKEYSNVAAGILKKLEVKRPDYTWDGSRNLWILKPGYKCRGIGIVIRSALEEILQFTSNNQCKQYIAQKYVERPLLIYNTKFDIRQYMLLSITGSVAAIWLYKDCYLRFSSQVFTLDNMRECVHLTNNAVQKRYKNNSARDSRLPKKNMWSMEQFKVYLKHRNAPPDTWEKTVFAGFRKNIIAVALASFEDTEFMENSFELYGCDFMLDEQYNPILIEVNSNPDLSASSDVTARICPMVLKDLVKVVVDVPRDAKASTGQFELAYEVNYQPNRDFVPHVDMDVAGKTMNILKSSKADIPRQVLSKKRIQSYCKPIKKPIIKNSVNNESKDSLVVLKRSPGFALDHALSKKNFKFAVNHAAIQDKASLKAFAKEALALRYTLPK